MSLPASTVAAVVGVGGGTGGGGSTAASVAALAALSGGVIATTPIGIPGLQDASGRVRSSFQDVKQRTDELQGLVEILYGAVAALAGGADSGVVRTVITLTLDQVLALGAVSGPVDIELTPLLPAGSTIINALATLTSAFVSSVTPYDLSVEFIWRANDSVAPDAIPLDIAAKVPVSIGNDVTPPDTYQSFAATVGDTPFAANANAYRWPYTPTLVARLTATGTTFDTFTEGQLQIVVASVTML